MNLYKSYCYPTIEDVRDQFVSDPVLGSGWVIISSYNTDTTITLKAVKGTNTRFYKIDPPTCTSLGFQNSYSGISIPDAIEITGLSLVFLSVCYVGKMLRRSM